MFLKIEEMKNIN